MSVDPNAERVSHNVRNLTGGMQYEFDVRARTEAGIGQPPSQEAFDARTDSTSTLSHNPLMVAMPVWRKSSCLLVTSKTLFIGPPIPTGKPEILSDTVRARDFATKMHTDMFSTQNGLLSKYAVIVYETDENGSPIGDHDAVDTAQAKVRENTLHYSQFLYRPGKMYKALTNGRRTLLSSVHCLRKKFSSHKR